MKLLFFLLVFTYLNPAFGQKIQQDLYLKHSMKQDGESFQFTVLDRGEKGVRRYNKSKFYFWFKAQRVLATQGGASGQLLDGPFESFYENKQLCRKGNFSKGLKNGEWLYWRSNGVLIRSEYWKNGRKSGTEKVYDETGNVYETIVHKHYKFTRTTPDSLIRSNVTGTRKTIYTRDPQGEILTKSTYKDGLLDGTSTTYANGKAVSETKYKKGEPVVAKPKKEKAAKPAAVTPSNKPKKNFFSFLHKKDPAQPKQPKASKVKQSKGQTPVTETPDATQKPKKKWLNLDFLKRKKAAATT
jgi:antitoxin component YwqK of YwqJK toxin-antitoxin module